jgi:AcrR family transcriptional regulator
MKQVAQTSAPAARARGRPREFDLDRALDQAIRVFREHGYHATSIGDLAQAMGLACGSIYKAFRDKRAIFLAALDRYGMVRNAQVERIANAAGPARDRLRDVLTFYAESARGIEGRRGCMVVGSAVDLALADREVATRVNASLARNEALLAALIRRGQAEGDIAHGVDAEQTARVMVFLTQGMRVAGKAGRPPPDTTAIIDIAMKLLA